MCSGFCLKGTYPLTPLCPPRYLLEWIRFFFLEALTGWLWKYNGINHSLIIQVRNSCINAAFSIRHALVLAVPHREFQSCCMVYGSPVLFLSMLGCSHLPFKPLQLWWYSLILGLPFFREKISLVLLLSVYPTCSCPQGCPSCSAYIFVLHGRR